MRSWLFALLFLLSGGVLLHGQDLFDNDDDDFGAKTKVSLLVEAASAKAGTTVYAGLHLKMPEGWHTYWKNPGDSGEATKVIWTLPDGITAGEIKWPVPERVEAFDQFTYAYHHEVLLIVPLQLAKDVKSGEYELKGTVTWLECEETCLPGEKEVSTKLVVGVEKRLGQHAELFAQSRKHWSDSEAMPKLKASWAGPANKEGMRPVHFEVPLEGGKIEFLPFGTEDLKWSIKHESTYKQDKGSTVITKFIKSEAGIWPEKIPGVVRVEKDGQVTGYKTDFVVSASQSQNEESKSIWLILGGAFLGGMILNIMPCVLPVISLKILGFVQQSQNAPERVRKLGLTYGLGVWASFLGLAGMIISIKNNTGMAAWGMQMQNPLFNLVLLLVVTLVALNLFGVFEVNLGGGAMGKANELASREGYMGAFFNGVLATALATPCTAPFLAGAMGVALTQGQGVIIAAMSAVAFGLAAPYVLLSFKPNWLKFLPKPGDWMVQFKVIMGFPMLAAAFWLLSFTGPMYGKGGALWLGVLMCFVALAARVFGEFKQRKASESLKPIVVSLLLLVGGYGMAMEWGLDWRQSKPKIPWQDWTPAAEVQARKSGNPVLVDFTADWCPTCKANKRISIEIDSVRSKLKEIGAVSFLGDYTNKNPSITKILQKYKRAGVPLVLVYPVGQDEPIVLPVTLTPQIVLDALGEAGRFVP